MIQFLKHNEIDKSKWDACVNNSINGNIYAYSWYLDIVCEGWNALIEDDYISIFPLTAYNKIGIQSIYTPFFTQQLGLFSINTITEDNLNAFIQSIPKYYKSVELNLNINNALDNKQFKISNNLNHTLDLNETYDKIKANYSDNLKRNLKKAIQATPIIVTDTKAEDIITIFKHNKGKDINHLKEADYYRLTLLINKCIEKGVAKVYGVTSDNELCAGAVFIKTDNRIIFLFSATNNKAKEIFAMPYLIDKIIHDNSETNYTFDFEGSNDKNLARFYKSFGSKEEYYPTIYINKLSFIMNIGIYFYKKAKKYL